MSKESVYDEKVFPLMAEILAVCKEHDISMVASFELDVIEGDDDPLMCTSVLISKRTISKALRRAEGVLAPRPGEVAFALAEIIETRPDGSKKVTIRRMTP